MKLIIASLVIACAVVVTSSSYELSRGYINSRIVGGRYALENEFPFVVRRNIVFNQCKFFLIANDLFC